jgi:transcriptional regulator with XRE-family HTH domain
MTLLGDRLREIRQEKGLSQEELAERVGLGRRQIHRYENGLSQPSGTIVSRIAMELKVSSDYLLGLVDGVGVEPDSLLPEEKQLIQAFRQGDLVEIARLFTIHWLMR